MAVPEGEDVDEMFLPPDDFEPSFDAKVLRVAEKKKKNNHNIILLSAERAGEEERE